MATNKFDLEEIGSILDLLTKNDVREFKLERNSDRLWLRRGPLEPQQVVSYGAPQYQQPVAAQPVYSAPSSAPSAGAVSQSTEPLAAKVASSAKEVKSPMVGTFYRRPAVDAKPYAEVGDIVKKGQTLCIIEAMKLMNEIESDVAGKVVEVCLEDAQMVEYGEVLFRIDPV